MEFFQSMNLLNFISICVLSVVNQSDGYNILAVFPTPTISHQQSCQGVTKALAKRGHNVTVITTDPNPVPIPNHHEIDVSIIYKVFSEYQKQNNFNLQTKLSPFFLLPMLTGAFEFNSDTVFSNEQVQRMLNSSDTKFDLIIYEGLYPSALGLRHRYNYIPSIVIFTIPFYLPVSYSMGNPVNPSYIPSFSTDFNDRMTFYERLKNLFYSIYEIYVHKYFMYPKQDAIVKKYFGDDCPSVEELERNNSLMFLSGDLSQSYSMPFQPNTVQIGTLHATPNHKPLSNELKTWMDGADKGVIYFSLGSNMKSVSMENGKIQAFAKAFEKFPNYRVIWKWESDKEFPGKPSNVFLVKWLPQQAILAHNKTKVFISHCGHQSRQESIHYGVPIIGVPLFWDQDWNCKKLVTSGAAKLLDFTQITYEDVFEKLNAVLTDESYGINMKKLSILSKDKPMTSEETINYWVDHVIRHKGAPHLRPAVLDLYWYQSTLIDIAAFLLSVIFLISYSIYFVVRRIITLKSSVKIKVKSS